MSRAAIAGLPSGAPLIDGLPAVFHGDEFLVRMLDGFDEVLAPVHAVVRDLDAYFDPALCPTDFLEWLATWLGVELNSRWPLQRRRELLRRAVEVHRMRGTSWGVSNAVELYTGVAPEITENGAAAASPTPGAALPGGRQLGLSVTVRTRSNDIDEAVVDRIVAATKPAHVPHQVSVVIQN
jgi:phage tail-like protein